MKEKIKYIELIDVWVADWKIVRNAIQTLPILSIVINSTYLPGFLNPNKVIKVQTARCDNQINSFYSYSVKSFYKHC